MHPYEWETFREDVEGAWRTLKPLYENIHTYLRSHLIRRFGAKHVSNRGPIPSHLFGDIEARTPIHMPDTLRSLMDSELQNVTVTEMVELGESFYKSLGFSNLSFLFWNNSIFQRPTSKTSFICDASAWDFCDGKDFR